MRYSTIKLNGCWYVVTPGGAIIWRQYRWWLGAWRAAKRMERRAAMRPVNAGG